MPGAIVQAVYAFDDSGANATTISVAINGVVAARLLDAHAGWGSNTITCTVSDGTAYTNADGPRLDTNFSQRGQVFFKPNSGGGNFTVTATFSAAVAFRRLRAYENSGIVTASPLDQATGQFQLAAGTGTDAVTSGATATTTNAATFLKGYSQNTTENDPGTGTLNAGTNYTKFGANSLMGMESRSVVATGAYAATWTQSVNNARVSHIVAWIETVSPTITAHPTEQTVADGAAGVFGITATNATSYQWQTQAPAGGAWGNVSGGSGATTDTYTTPALSRASDAGRLYRCLVNGTTTTNAAAARVTLVPTSYASAVGLVIGSSASFVGESHAGALDTAGGVVLAGTAAGQATPAGALSITAHLLGSSIGLATPTGTLTVAINPAGAVVGVALVTGAVSMGNVLAGDAQGQAAVSGGLAIVKPLAASAQGLAAISGGLSIVKPLAGLSAGLATPAGGLTVISGVALAGGVQGRSDVSGAIGLVINFSAQAVAQALVQGAISLSGSVALAGSALGRADTSGTLSLSKQMQAAVAGLASVSQATLQVVIQMSASSQGRAAGAGTLIVDIGMSGAALGQALAQGALSLAINFSGAAVAQALVGGALSGGAGLAQLSFARRIRRDRREFRVARTARVFRVAPPAREWRIAA